MSLEELKKEAEKLGYTLVPKKERVRRLGCFCGRKVPKLIKSSSRWGRFYVYCPTCGTRGPVIQQESDGDVYAAVPPKSKTIFELENEAIEAWNHMIGD